MLTPKDLRPAVFSGEALIPDPNDYLWDIRSPEEYIAVFDPASGDIQEQRGLLNAATAGTVTLPRECVILAAASTDPTIRWMVAGGSADADILDMLVADPTPLVISALATNPSASDDAYARLAGRGSDALLAANPSVPAETLSTIALSETPRGERGYLTYARELVTNPNTPENVLRLLFDHAAGDVPLLAVRHSNAPVKLLEDILDGLRPGVSATCSIAAVQAVALADPRIGKSQVERVCAGPMHPGVLIAACSNAKTPAVFLRDCAQSGSVIVRATVAANTSTPVDLLPSLAEDSDSLVRFGLAMNPNTPLAILAEIAAGDEGSSSTYWKAMLDAPFADVEPEVLSQYRNPVEVARERIAEAAEDLELSEDDRARAFFLSVAFPPTPEPYSLF